jgi:NitT/TauT family transport system permease protein
VQRLALDQADATSWHRYFGVAWPPLLAAVLLLAFWELAVWWFKLPNFVLPSPREIVKAAMDDPHRLLLDTWVTVTEALVGYLAGSALGLGLALLFVTFVTVERLALPVYVTINSVPMVAYGPLAIIWLGIGSPSKIILI